MAYREIAMIEIKEVFALVAADRHGLRPIAELVGVDRKTVRRYIEAAQAVGLVCDGGEGQLTDELLGAVIKAVRLERPAGHGAAWEACRAEHDRIKAWLEKNLKLTKVADLLALRGVEAPTAPCTATRPTGSGSAGRASRSRWSMVSLGMSCRTISAGCVRCPIPSRASAARCGR